MKFLRFLAGAFIGLSLILSVEAFAQAPDETKSGDETMKQEGTTGQTAPEKTKKKATKKKKKAAKKKKKATKKTETGETTGGAPETAK